MDRGFAGIVMAGGEGTRLRALTRALAGDDRPKQFCRLFGSETLLAQTRRRAGLLVPAERLLTVVTRCHERFWRPALVGVAPRTVVVQPESRGTAAALLLALLRLRALAPTAPVVMLPSDHWVSDDAAFMARVEGALEAVLARPDLVVLLGIEPDRPETGYGWIEPAELILGAARWPLYGVGRFREKPALPLAERLLCRGALWNSFVVVGRPATLERLIGDASPGLAEALAPLAARRDPPREAEAARAAYARLAPVDLSRDVLEARAERLAVLPVTGVAWNDLGEPARVLATRARLAPALATA